MMTTATDLHQFARDVFEEEWELSHRPCCDGPLERLGLHGPAIDVCPVSWLLPELVDLVSQNSHRPVREYDHTIRQLIEDQQLQSHFRDNADSAHYQDALDEYVDMIVNVMERVRVRALATGQFGVATAPQMFG